MTHTVILLNIYCDGVAGGSNTQICHAILRKPLMSLTTFFNIILSLQFTETPKEVHGSVFRTLGGSSDKVT